MVDVLLIEQRLEDAVREAHHEDVLDGFLSEVVVDPVDLLLGEYRRQRVVDKLRRFEASADRFFDDKTIVGPDHAGSTELLDCWREQRRRDSEVVEAMSGQAALMLDHVEACA